MTGDDGQQPFLEAGEFGAWLDALQASLAGGGPMEVPCGDCTACCRSAQFIDVGADEHAALARTPAALLVPAPGRPGTLVLGFDAEGRCPMLGDHGCTIYRERPRACRSYDCRVFAAAGVDPGAEGRGAIAARARRWQFHYASENARHRHRALVARARRLAARGGHANATALALLAVRDVTTPEPEPDGASDG